MAAVRAADAEVLLPEQAGYLELDDASRKTSDVSQVELKKYVDIRTSNNSFSLELPEFGPYYFDYTRNGKFLLLGGRRGHMALLDWKSKTLVSETHVKDYISDVTFLQNETWYAVAQAKGVHIYDKNATELHVMKGDGRNNCDALLEYLPYHWLLVSAGKAGLPRWLDVSMGQVVAEGGRNMRQGFDGKGSSSVYIDQLGGPAKSLRQNPWNAITCVGHARGVVSMWAPSLPEPVVKMMCHKGPVCSIAVHRGGHTMVTAGVDSFVHVWDLRTYQKLHSFRTRGKTSSVDISDRGLIAMGDGHGTVVYPSYSTLTESTEPYMCFKTPVAKDLVNCVRFCPYEDVLGIGRNDGFSSCIIPGSGEPNFDTREANPFMSKKMRRESEVKSLLDKAPFDTIVLDPNDLGAYDAAAKDEEEEGVAEDAEKRKPKFKQRAKTSYDKRKRIVADDDARKERADKLWKQKEEALAGGGKKKAKRDSDDVLSRFLDK